MMIYSNGSMFGENGAPNKIDRSSLKFLTYQLENMLNTYKRYIFYATEDDQVYAIKELEKYLELLKQERYDLLIQDTRVINDDIPHVPRACYPHHFIEDENLPF